MKQNVAITGIGAVTPLAMTGHETWKALKEGNSGAETVKAFNAKGFDSQIAGEVEEFKINKNVPKYHRKAAKLMNRDIQLSVLAANDAFADSGLLTKASLSDSVTYSPEKFAIIFGAGVISCELEEIASAMEKAVSNNDFDLKKWGTDGLNALTPLWLLKYLPNTLACHVGIIHDLQGPSNSIVCGEASGILAIAEAADIIERGDAEAAIAGGCEAKVNPIVFIRQSLLKRAAVNSNDNPAQACRPFDKDASGTVVGEGGGMVILENQQTAIDRNAEIYALIAGSGASNNINQQYESIEEDALGIQYSIEMAMERAGVSPEDIDLVIPHGIGVPKDDISEAKAIQNALKGAKPLCLPTKSQLTNTGAAAGAIDVVMGCCAIKEGFVPKAVNFTAPAQGCELNIPTEDVKKDISCVLCCSYTYGSQTSALILKKP